MYTFLSANTSPLATCHTSTSFPPPSSSQNTKITKLQQNFPLPRRKKLKLFEYIEEKQNKKMSGGVGPCSDISLPQEQQEQAHKHLQDPLSLSKTPPSSGRRGLFNFRQLNALVVAVVLASSGMVDPQDFAFAVFSLIYIFFLAKASFPSHAPVSNTDIDRSNIFHLYVFLGAMIGLFLPIAYIFEGIYEGDKEGIKAAAPHVFLLACQIFVEGLAISAGFSTPIRVFIPIMYNTVRMYALMEWVQAEISKAEELHSGSEMRLYVGRGLAIANTAFWCFNLCGFLLPIYLPKALKNYYSSDMAKEAKKN